MTTFDENGLKILVYLRVILVLACVTLWQKISRD